MIYVHFVEECQLLLKQKNDAFGELIMNPEPMDFLFINSVTNFIFHYKFRMSHKLVKIMDNETLNRSNIYQ